MKIRTSEAALLSQVKLLATHIEHAAEYVLAVWISKLASANNQIGELRTTTYTLESSHKKLPSPWQHKSCSLLYRVV